jgi:hypothetical protein
MNMSRIPTIGYVPPVRGKDEHVRRLKRLIIWLESDTVGPIGKLTVRVRGFTPQDSHPDGILVDGIDQAKPLIRELINAAGPSFVEPERSANRTPLDFTVHNEMLVVLVLEGEFWRFRSSNDSIASEKGHGQRYHRLCTWHPDGTDSAVEVSDGNPTRLISFRTGMGKRNRNDESNGPSEEHKFFLYVDFVNPDGRIMPTLIDPNVENKGGPG